MADFDFGLGSITDSLTKQSALQGQRQEEQLKQQGRVNAANNELSKIAKKSTEISQSVVESMRPLQSVLDENEQARMEMEELKSSGNPMSFLEVVGKQIADPGKYTRDGRTKRLAEVNQATNARIQIASTQQAALQDLGLLVKADLESSTGTLNMATLLEAQSQERINTEINRVKTQGEMLASSAALAEQQLANMNDDQLKVAYQQSNGKPVDVGGVMISPGALETRMRAVEERALMARGRAAELEKKNYEAAKLFAQKELETYSAEELRPMLLNGSPDYELADIKKAYDIKTQAASDSNAAMMQKFSFLDFGARVTVPAMEDAMRMDSSVPAGSPLARSLAAYKNTIGTVMGITSRYEEGPSGEHPRDKSQMNPPARGQVPIEVMAASSGAIEEARKKLDADIEKEAGRKGRGNKNLTDMYREYYRGNDVPQASMEEYLQTNLEKNLPVNDVLPNEQAVMVKNLFNSTYAELKAQASQQPFGAPDDKTLKQQAAQVAMQKVVASTVGQKKTEELYANQLSMPDSPLRGIYKDSNQLLRDMREADAEGLRVFQQTKGLTDAEMNQVQNGQQIPGKVSRDDVVQLSVTQTQKFLLSLDRKEKGLSQRYIAWWSSNGQRFADELQKTGLARAKGAGIQQMGLESYAGPLARESANRYMQILEGSAPGYEREKEARVNRLTSFDSNPEYTQAALLSWDKTLSDRDRQTIMKEVIRPIINQAKEKKMDYEQTNRFVDETLAAAHFQNPQVQSAVKKMLANRPNQLELLTTVIETPWWQGVNESIPADIRGQMNVIGTDMSRLRRSAQSYNWYKQLDE